MITEMVLAHIRENIHTEDYRHIPGEFYRVGDHMEFTCRPESITPQVLVIAAVNLKIIDDLRRVRGYMQTPQIGDWVRVNKGDSQESLSRITVLWPNQNYIQVGGSTDSSCFMFGNGSADYSGTCGDALPLSALTKSGETKEAMFWFFSRNESGGNRSIRFYLKAKVWDLLNH